MTSAFREAARSVPGMETVSRHRRMIDALLYSNIFACSTAISVGFLPLGMVSQQDQLRTSLGTAPYNDGGLSVARQQEGCRAPPRSQA